MNQLMLQDGIHYLKINGIMHWCKVAGTAHNTVPLIIVHGIQVVIIMYSKERLV